MREAGLEGKILRPLSAKALDTTFVEQAGNTYSIIVAFHESEDDIQIKHTSRYHHSITIK